MSHLVDELAEQRLYSIGWHQLMTRLRPAVKTHYSQHYSQHYVTRTPGDCRSQGGRGEYTGHDTPVGRCRPGALTGKYQQE
eukprot:1186949-Prorocentrum_minimum.AAC.2